MPMGLFFMGSVHSFIFQSIVMILFTAGEMLVFTRIDIKIDEISGEIIKVAITL